MSPISALLALLALYGCGGDPEPTLAPSAAAERPAERPPNVLIVMWDTVRADRLSLYGHGRPTTPALAAWSDGATVYEQAWSAGTWTVPAHASVFTGLPIPTHGATGEHRWLDDGHRTLAELLSARGYDTVALSANLYVGSVANLLQGFATVHTTYPSKVEKRGRYVQAALDATRNKRIPEDASTEISPAFVGSRAEQWDKSVYKDAAPVLAQGLLDHLDERRTDAPWFAYLNFMEAHTPRIPSQASRVALLTEQERADALSTDMSLFAENAWMVGVREYGERELAAFGSVYDAALLDLDVATARLLAELEGRGVLEDTVVIVMSDHGESLGEHRMLEHRWTVHEPVLHVPLVIRYPRGGFAGRRVSTPVSTLDLFDTVLELTGTPRPDVLGLHSRTLTDEAGREVVHAQLVHAVAAELKPIHRAFPDLDLSRWKQTWDTARDPRFKWVKPAGQPGVLYDLASDPGELVDVAAQHPEVATRLSAELEGWVAGHAAPRPGASARDASAEERAQLEILGYTQEDGE